VDVVVVEVERAVGVHQRAPMPDMRERLHVDTRDRGGGGSQAVPESHAPLRRRRCLRARNVGGRADQDETAQKRDRRESEQRTNAESLPRATRTAGKIAGHRIYLPEKQERNASSAKVWLPRKRARFSSMARS